MNRASLRLALVTLGTTLVLSMTAAAQTAVGYLTVSSTPPAKVLVDNEDSGRTTPVEKLALPPGDHRLTLVTADGALKRTFGFKITPNQTTRLKIKL